MRFLMLIHSDENAPQTPPPRSLLDAMDVFRADVTLGRIMDDGGLAPTSASTRLRTDAGRVTVLDGPFAEAKEVVGGFFVVESRSSSDVAAWARQFVEMHATHWPQVSYLAEIRQIADPGA